MGEQHIHGCWVTGDERVCEDGTKGCAREHPLRDGRPNSGTFHCSRCGAVTQGEVREMPNGERHIKFGVCPCGSPT